MALIKVYFYIFLMIFFVSCSMNSGFYIYDLNGEQLKINRLRYSNYKSVKLYFDRQNIDAPYEEINIIESKHHYYGEFYFDKVFMSTLNKKVSLLDVDALIFETDLSKYSFYKKDNLYFTAIKFK